MRFSSQESKKLFLHKLTLYKTIIDSTQILDSCCNPDVQSYLTSDVRTHRLTGMIKAQVSTNYYGAKTESDASLPLSAEAFATQSKKYPIKVTGGGILEDECLDQKNRLLPLK